MLMQMRYFIFGIFIVLSSCKTYYYKQQKFNYYFESQNYAEAEKRYAALEKPNGHNRLLYLLNLGMLSHLQGKYEQSNQHFEQAYYYTQDYYKNFSADVASIFVGSSVNKYLGNPLEVLLINYYKALNYSLLGQNEKAMVECRRAFNALQYLDDKYVNNNKYQRDPYIYNTIGLIFEAGKEDNMALVCLKRAVDIYQNGNVRQSGVGLPEQLKYDVIRLAQKVGDFTAADNYIKEFGVSYSKVDKPQNCKEVLLFWHNGLGPVKTESNIMFNITNNGGGNLMFVNDDLALNIPVILPISSSNSSTLNSLTFIRMALPKYRERYLVYNQGEVVVDSTKNPFYVGQDFNAINKKILKDQFVTNLSQSLIRVTLRQIASMSAAKQNDLLALGINIAGFVMEKSDTRNWQSLPHTAYYTRVYVPQDKSTIQVKLYGADQKQKTVTIKTDTLSTKSINIVNVITPEFSRY